MTATTTEPALVENMYGGYDLTGSLSDWEVFKVKGNRLRFRNKRTVKISKWVHVDRLTIRVYQHFEGLIDAMNAVGKAALDAEEAITRLVEENRPLLDRLAESDTAETFPPDDTFNVENLTEWKEPVPSGSASGTLVVPDPEWDPEDFWPHATRVYTITNPKHGETYSLGGDLIQERLDNYLALGKSDLLLLARSQDIKTTTRMTKFDLAVALIRHVPSDPAY